MVQVLLEYYMEQHTTYGSGRTRPPPGIHNLFSLTGDKTEFNIPKVKKTMLHTDYLIIAFSDVSAGIEHHYCTYRAIPGACHCYCCCCTAAIQVATTYIHQTKLFSLTPRAAAPNFTDSSGI